MSSAHKLNPAMVPTAAEIIEAIRRHTHPPFDIWSGQAGYGPLNIPDFLDNLDEVVAESVVPGP